MSYAKNLKRIAERLARVSYENRDGCRWASLSEKDRAIYTKACIPLAEICIEEMADDSEGIFTLAREMKTKRTYVPQIGEWVYPKVFVYDSFTEVKKKLGLAPLKEKQTWH